MVEIKKCTSCNRSISNDENTSIFPCPGCLKEELRRCGPCKATVVPYKCPKCGFEGP